MKALKNDYRLFGAILILLVFSIVGLLKNQIACSTCIVPFGPEEILESGEIFSPPGHLDQDETITKVHYWGTDGIGRDVASRLIHGITVALMVGMLSSIITLIISLLLGFVSGYYGNKGQKSNFFQVGLLIILLVLAHFYAVEWSYEVNTNSRMTFDHSRFVLYWIPLSLLALWISSKFRHFSFGQFFIQWDNIVIKLIEIFKSIPRLFLLLAIFAIITKPSLIGVILIIGLIRWPNLTRIIRAEIMALRQEEFIQNAKILGLPDKKIMIKHILPNIYKPILIMTAFNAGSAILIESSLSFLNIGLPGDQVSFGRMLGEAREYFGAWWLAVGPGVFIFVLIFCFNVIGDRLSYHFEESKR